MIALLYLIPVKHEEVAICKANLRSCGAIRGYRREASNIC